MCKRFLSSIKSKKHLLLIIVSVSVIIVSGLLYSRQFTGATTNQLTDKNKNNFCDMKSAKGFSVPVVSFEKENLSEKEIIIKQKTEEKILAVKIENNKSEKRTKLVLVTAFSSTVDQTDSTPFITANGTRVHDGTIAANFLKFGTKVKFPSLYGDKIFIVEDRMKSDYKVDIWFPTRQEALNFGAKRVEIEIQ